MIAHLVMVVGLPLAVLCNGLGQGSVLVEPDVSNRYVVTLRPNVTLEAHLDFVDKAQLALNVTGYEGVTHRYWIGDFGGYAAHIPPSAVTLLRAHEDVIRIEDDEILEEQLFDERECCDDSCVPSSEDASSRLLSAESSPMHEIVPPHIDVPDRGSLVTQRNPPYHLHRISHRRMNDRENYWYDRSAGVGTYAYILDSGIAALHQEFQGRARLAFNAFSKNPPHDTSGHGTYIAGLVGGKTYGVAKRTNILAVKILHNKRTTLSTVLHGLQWATNDVVQRRRQRMSVVHMSMSGPFNQAFNNAIDSAYAKGVIVVVPAGNQAKSATTMSPASALGALTVGATDYYRNRAGFSNYGNRVSIFAPGVNVCSAWPGNSRTRTHRASGTAASAAMVAGLVVYFKGYNLLYTPAETWELMALAATRDVVKNRGAPGLFAYNFSTK